MIRLRFLTVLFCVFVANTISDLASVEAEVKVPGFYTDHMVLQRQMPIRLRGWADPGEAITLQLGTESASATADGDGQWKAELPAMEASSKPTTLTISGSNTITIKDVLIGEVWLCSGQSNMEWTVAQCGDAKKEIAEANYPVIRHLKIGHKPSTVPLDDLSAKWQICSPETAGSFSACSYYMGRQLLKELDVPIGLVNSSWGGTRIEPWTAPSGFAAVPKLSEIHSSVMGRTPGTEAYESTLNQHISATEDWLNSAKQSAAAGASVSSSPTFPASLVPFTRHQDPTMLYNGMIHALVGYPIRGAIWYQGESNHAEGMLYFEKKKALIGGWRDLWRQEDFPFYFVQIGPYNYGSEDPTILPRFWEAQEAVLKLPNTGMVVINDIATLNNVHPPNKQEVGLRLANLALKNDYGRSDVVAGSPRFESLKVSPGQLVLTFSNTGGGLKTSDGQTASDFEIVGPGSDGFKPAIAKIIGDTVVLTSSEVKAPTAFRFAWHKLAEPNLRGGTGMPVGAVRGGKEPSFADNLPISDEYSLVYDLDLSKLGPQIQYDVAVPDTAGEFDRVAYLLELKAAGQNLKSIFVSMDAWTNDASKLAVPTLGSGAVWQTTVNNLTVQSNVEGVQSGSNLKSGSIEFWPSNYGPMNSAKVPNASDSVYDFGDSANDPADGYGSMQIHNSAAQQTLIAVNHWKVGNKADIGIGNSSGRTKDWTFTGNADTYSKKRLRVFVRKK
ncbi:MAG: sialate O-acetylesterase [Fuerstiella sp.]